MHADDFFRTLGQRANLGNGDGRSVRRQDDFGAADGIEVAKELRLNVEFFGSSLDDEIAGGKRIALDGGLDSLDGGNALLRRQLLLGDLAVHVLADSRD